MAQVIALEALSALELSYTTFHEPFQRSVGYAPSP
jgi:hypothetical protein